jgi:hypothetical protein
MDALASALSLRKNSLPVFGAWEMHDPNRAQLEAAVRVLQPLLDGLVFARTQAKAH